MQGSIDFTGLLSGDIIGEGGTTVVANPSGSATDTLNKVQIDETIYDVEGGGGTEVIANPTGTPTEDINAIEIDEVIYQIKGEKGDDGADGTDGTSAYASVSKVGNTATITCTDANGTTTAQISDGTNGTDGQGVPTGGTAGQVLIKDSATDYDTSWTSLDASDIPYDNTTSGMTATDVQDAVSELKSNLTQLNGLTVYRNLTPQTSYASFNDGSNLPLISLTTNIVPVQAGSGDPSPSNIRPISGWTACNVTRSGANLFDKTTITENKIINNNTGEEITSYGRFSSDYIKVNSSTDYYASNVIKSAQWYCAFYYDKNKNYLSCGELSSTGDTASGVITTPSNCNYIRLVGVTTYKDDVSFVAGNQAPTSYEPYNGTTYTIQFKDGDNPLTVYGGTLDVVSGVLTITDGYIASYNSEALPSTWISDRDVYAEGTTPTVGAEVVYKLATPQTYQLTPTEVNSLLGQNYIFSDTGNITNVKYIGVLNFS